MNNDERLDMLKGEWSQGIPWSQESKEWLLRQAERVQELEEKHSHLEKLLKKQTTNAFDGWEKVIELEKENERYEQAWEIAKTKALGWGSGENIPDDDEEIAYQAGVQDMFEYFVDYYKKALGASWNG